MILTFLMAAASDPTTTGIVGVLLQYGAVGAVALTLGFFARTLIKREQERADRLEVEAKEARLAYNAEVSRLNTLIQEKTIPALLTATSAINNSQQLLQSLQYQRDIELQIKRQQEKP